MTKRYILPLYPKRIRHEEHKDKELTKEELENECPGLTDIFCPFCLEECWISSEKSRMRKNSQWELICWNCITDKAKEDKDIEMIQVKI